MKKIIIIDGNNLLFRAFPIAKSKGSNCLEFVLDMLFRIKNYDEKKARLVFAFDTTKSIRRLKLFPEYKGNRKSNLSQEDKDQRDYYLNEFINLIRVSGCTILDGNGYEADDYIAAFSRMLNPIYDVLIVSTDADLYQLITENISVFNPIKGLIIKEENFENIMGLTKAQFIDYKCINGDSSDNIGGYPRVGDKITRRYLKEHGNYQNIFKYCNTVNGKKTCIEERFCDESIYKRNKELVDLSYYYADNTIRKLIKMMVDRTEFHEMEMYKIMTRNDLSIMFDKVKTLCKMS